MTTMLALSGQKRLRIWGLIATCVLAAAQVGAQTPAPRIRSEISGTEMSLLKGSLHPYAQPQFDAGRMPANTQLKGVSIAFSRSAAQEADLQALLVAQQNPSSPLYHQWLTPDQYASRFGMAQADIDRVETWLEQQGFSIDSVARSRNLIRFSGNVGQVEQTFQTQMHYYNVEGAKHFAPSTNLSLPTAIAPAIANVGNLNDFRPKAQHISGNKGRARPAFTSGVSGNVFFAPGDIKVVYDMNPLLGGGYNGAGQSIAVMGQSAVMTSDLENFQNAASLTVKDPTMVLVPGTGTSQVFADGDEEESDLDLEWSNAMAPGADIFFVYTGSDQSYGVFDSIQYAVDNNIGNIITASYGNCETAFTQAEITQLEGILSQGASQGQSILASSGDSGSTACAGNTSLTTAQQEALAVNYPASSEYVTGMGGTEITSADDVATNSTYWDAETPNTDILTSAKIYIPEVVWNDDTSQSGLSAGGGGASTIYTQTPSWQTGVPGIPTTGKRYVPDVALYSSPNFPGYLFCTSDETDWASGQTASCGSGFRGSASDNSLTIAGGTSFAAPIFAGMMAIINQKANYTSGQGLLNTELYKLASNAGTYATAFHDVTSGNNDCTAGSTYCSGTAGFSAGVGYDEVTGLGSVDLNNLATAYAGSTTTLIGTTTSVSPSNTAPALNANDTFTITVTSATGVTIPSGTVAVSVDGATAVNETLTANGTYAYSTSFATTGGHTVVAEYMGDTTHAASTGAATVTVPGSSSGTGTFSFTPVPTNVTVAQGSSGSSTITVLPAGGYTGTVYLAITNTSNNTALANLCYGFTTTLSNGDGSVTVSGTTAVTTQLTFDTNASDCVSAAVVKGRTPGMHRLFAVKTAKNSTPSGPNPAPMAVAFAGLLLAGFLGRSSRKFRTMAGLIALLAVGLAISACGGGGSGTPPPPPDPAKGTYTISIGGQDSATATINASTTMTLTID